jgi:hypothetical protein
MIDMILMPCNCSACARGKRSRAATTNPMPRSAGASARRTLFSGFHANACKAASASSTDSSSSACCETRCNRRSQAPFAPSAARKAWSHAHRPTTRSSGTTTRRCRSRAAAARCGGTHTCGACCGVSWTLSAVSTAPTSPELATASASS